MRFKVPQAWWLPLWISDYSTHANFPTPTAVEAALPGCDSAVSSSRAQHPEQCLTPRTVPQTPSVGEAAYVSPASSYPGADTQGGVRVAGSAEVGGFSGADLWQDSREE